MKRLPIITYLNRTFLLLFACCFVQAVLAQSGAMKRSWAFAKERTYGRELRDMEGKPVQRNDTAYFLYLETSGKNIPQISSVTYKGRVFHAAIHAVPDKEIIAGAEQQTGKKFTLKKAAANRLWLVELSASEEKAPSRTYLFVKGKMGKQPFSLRFSQFVLLLPDNAG